MQTLLRKVSVLKSNPGPSCDEATVLTAYPLCRLFFLVMFATLVPELKPDEKAQLYFKRKYMVRRVPRLVLHQS